MKNTYSFKGTGLFFATIEAKLNSRKTVSHSENSKILGIVALKQINFTDFGNKIKYILEGGKSSIGLESTIIDIRNKPKILRLGGIEISTIEKYLKKKVVINNNSSKISSPGQFKLHYSPGIPIRLNAKKTNKKEAYLSIQKMKQNKPNFYFLSKNGNLKEAAKNLYSTLRKIKKNKYKSIAVNKIPNKGLGKTINDRLKRASRF